MEKAKVVLIVGINSADPAQDEELDAWYENVHLPEVTQAPGVKSATRYRILEPAEGYPTFLTVYDMDGEDGLKKYEAFRQKQSEGKAPPFHMGPPLQMVWRKTYRYVGSSVHK